MIIARYNEDINWLQEYSVDFKIFIYNKGDDLSLPIGGRIIKLPNLGRESHTWLYHIVHNYENLSENNIFLQGRIDDLGCMSFKNPHKYLKKINSKGFCASRYGLLGPFHWKENIGIERDVRYSKDWFSGKITKSQKSFRNFAKDLFPEIPILVATSYGGCFAVTKEAIQKHDINFYKKLLDILSKSENPLEGHFMERLWCYMFTKNSNLKISLLDVLKTKLEKVIQLKY